jgi:hypothetical protein
VVQGIIVYVPLLDNNIIKFPFIDLEKLYLNGLVTDEIYNSINDKFLLYGVGSLGNVSISNQINSYAYCTGTNILIGSTVLPVNSVSGFSIGQEILIHQTQTDTELLGSHEYNIIDNIIGNNIYLKFLTVNNVESLQFSI